MKYLAPLFLLLAATAAAQDPDCGANYIVNRCLSTETPKTTSCAPNEWACLCAAYEAVASCYNNCPSDPRITDAQGQVTIYCQQAKLYDTSTVSTPSSTITSSSASQTPLVETTATLDAEDVSATGGALELSGDVGSVLVALAGVVVAVL